MYVESTTIKQDQQEQQRISTIETGEKLIMTRHGKSERAFKIDSFEEDWYSVRKRKPRGEEPPFRQPKEYEYRRSSYREDRPRSYSSGYKDRDYHRSDERRPYREERPRSYSSDCKDRDYRRSEERRPYRESSGYHDREYRDYRRSDDKRSYRESSGYDRPSERHHPDSHRLYRSRSELAAKEHEKAGDEWKVGMACGLGLHVADAFNMDGTRDNWQKLGKSAYNWALNESNKLRDKTNRIDRKYGW